MKFFEQIELLKRLDGLIRRKQTGSLEELAEKLDVSRATVCRYLTEMKDRGIPISYSSARRSYFYEGKVSLRFEFDAIDRQHDNKIQGGKKLTIVSFFETSEVYIHSTNDLREDCRPGFTVEGISKPLE